MADRSFLAWPFFEERHRVLAAAIDDWCRANLPVDHGDIDAACRGLVAKLGREGWLKHSAVDPDAPSQLDVRTLCLMRETLSRHDGLADFAFAMQGLGAGAISLLGNAAQRQWLKRTRAGISIAAFALSEAQSGSDVANLAMPARRDGGDYILDGEKTWISNGGIADFYVVFGRTGEAPGAKGLSAFLVPTDLVGLSIAERIDVIAPHPLARIRFDNARVPAAAMIGAPGEGFKIAMATLDVFRTTVGAAALGFARRALDEATARAQGRKLFGAPSMKRQSNCRSCRPSLRNPRGRRRSVASWK
jgi:acyl-CoA dehydrogenase